MIISPFASSPYIRSLHDCGMICGFFLNLTVFHWARDRPIIQFKYLTEIIGCISSFSLSVLGKSSLRLRLEDDYLY